MTTLPAGQETNPDDNGGQEATPTKRTITITVTDGVDNIGNATITIGTTTGQTGPRGAACTLENISDGKQTVSVAAEGYISKTEEITVSESSTTFTIILVEE